MILPYQRIKTLCEIDELIFPWFERTTRQGMTFGLSSAGYDVRIDQGVYIRPGGFKLASTIEHFKMPNDLLGHVADKSSWARQGLVVQNTIIEPGWRGFLTLELTNHSREGIVVRQGVPIAQIIFHQLAAPTDQPYDGKYQDQVAGPVEAIHEELMDGVE